VLLVGSFWRKLLVGAVAAAGFVWLYEATMLDSKDAAGSTTVADVMPPPEPGTRHMFSATAYCKGSVTAAGVAPLSGVAAADPTFLPLGSIIEIESPDSSYDGIYSVLDTGPAVQGREVDLYMWSCHDALRFGRKSVRITVLRLGWNPKATAPGFMDRLFRRAEAARPPATAPQAPDPTPDPLPSRPLAPAGGTN
jgi:3D (Asp-Asp-Asp) domain-containing protein